MIELKEIQEAAGRLSGKVARTPLFSSKTLGDSCGVQLYLKCECFQKTGSFKPRGALNKILSLGPAEREKGLITVSAGNHAQAVAWAAGTVQVQCAVVMPTDAPSSKIDAVQGYGAEVILHPDRATLFDKLHQERERRGATFVHPFDDRVVLAGAGTTGLEIIEDLPEVDLVVVPVGGGGLLGGIASAVKGLSPQTKVIAVELEAGPGLGPAVDAGEPISVQRPADTMADGMTPPFVGSLPLQIARKAVDEIVTVSESEIIATMKILLSRCKILAEGAGAAATAALLHGKFEIERGARVATVISGGNVDLDRLCTAFQSQEG